MRATHIILAGEQDERFWSALSLACTLAAQETPTRLFLSGAAVMLAAEDYEAAGDSERSRAGVPTVAELLDSAIDLGVGLHACQTGMALLGLEVTDLREDVRPDGLMAFLADVDDEDRLLSF
jgi:predicted peroxiredoxin